MPYGRPVLGTRADAAGQRNRLVTVEYATDGVGASGFPVKTWVTLGTIWMSRTDMRADEHQTSDQPSAFIEIQWNLPYRADMDPELVDVPKTRRLVFQGVTFDIRSASMIGWKQAIELVTLAQTAVAN